MSRTLSNPLDDAVARFVGCEAFDVGGVRLGPVTGLWLSASDEPEFAAITRGPREDDHRVVPLAGARLDGRRLLLPVPRRRVDEAPTLPSTTTPSALEVRRVLEHYSQRDPGPVAATKPITA